MDIGASNGGTTLATFGHNAPVAVPSSRRVLGCSPAADLIVLSSFVFESRSQAPFSSTMRPAAWRTYGPLARLEENNVIELPRCLGDFLSLGSIAGWGWCSFIRLFCAFRCASPCPLPSRVRVGTCCLFLSACLLYRRFIRLQDLSLSFFYSSFTPTRLTPPQPVLNRSTVQAHPFHANRKIYTLVHFLQSRHSLLESRSLRQQVYTRFTSLIVLIQHTQNASSSRM